MSKHNSVVAIYSTHSAAESAVKDLQHAGFNMQKLSIIGCDYHTDEHVIGYYNTGDRVKAWGKSGAFWGGLWGFMFGSAFFFVPGVGPLFVAGPLAGWIVGALEGAAIVGGLSALGAALCSVGIPRDSIVQYETALKAGKFLVIANTSAPEIVRARETLHSTQPDALEQHLRCTAEEPVAVC